MLRFCKKPFSKYYYLEELYFITNFGDYVHPVRACEFEKKGISVVFIELELFIQCLMHNHAAMNPI